MKYGFCLLLIVLIIQTKGTYAQYNKTFKIGFLDQDFYNATISELSGLNVSHGINNFQLIYLHDQNFMTETALKRGVDLYSTFSAFIGEFNYDIASISAILKIPYYVVKSFPEIASPFLIQAAYDVKDIGHAVTYLIEYKLTARVINLLGQRRDDSSIHLTQALNKSQINLARFNADDDNDAIDKVLATVIEKDATNSSFVVATGSTPENINLINRVLQRCIHQDLFYNEEYYFSTYVPKETMLPYRLAGATLITVNSKKYMPTMNFYRSNATLDSTVHFIRALANIPFINSTAMTIDVNTTRLWTSEVLMEYLYNYQHNGVVSNFHLANTSTTGKMNNYSFYIYVTKPELNATDLFLQGELHYKRPRDYRYVESTDAKTFLFGWTINFAFHNNTPFLTVSNTGVYSGFSHELLKLITLSRNVYFDYIETKENSIGTGALNGKNWTGLIKLLLNKEADVTAFPFPPTEAQKAVVDFSQAVLRTGPSLLVREQTYKIDYFELLQPFSIIVWLLIALTLVLLIIVLYVTNKISPNLSGAVEQNLSFGDSIFFAIGSIFMAKLLVKPDMISVRLFYLLFWFGALLLVASYAANLLALLSIPPENTPPFKDFSTLMEHRQQFKWVFEANSNFVELIKDEINDQMQSDLINLYHYAFENWRKEMFFNGSSAELVTYLQNNEHIVFIGYTAYTRKLALDNCNLVLLVPYQETVETYIAIRKDWQFAKQFNEWLNILKINGQVEFLSNTYLRSGICEYSAEGASYSGKNTKPLELKDVAGLFLVIAVGLVLSVPILILEVLGKNCRLSLQRDRYNEAFTYGDTYRAKVTSVDARGVWVSIRGSSYSLYIKSTALDNRKDKTDSTPTPTDMGIIVNTTLYLKYLGNDLETGDKKFVKAADKDN